MNVLRHTNPWTRAARLAVLVAVGVLLVSCGSDARPTAEAVAPNLAVSAAVPTTEPLSLPPADDTLPEFAPLPGAAVVVSPDADAATATTGDPDPELVGAAAPVETLSDEPASPDAISIDSASQWSDCLLAAAEQADAVLLLDPIAAGTATDLTSLQLNSVAAASVGCDFATTNLLATDLADHVATANTCLGAWLESSGGGSVFVGLASIGWGQPTPTWAQTHLVDALDSCFGGAAFAADVMSVVSTNRNLVGAFDAGCLAASFDDSGTMRSFAQAAATNPQAAAMNVGLGDEWVLSCANAGQIVAAAAAADGVALSSSTTTCIDGELRRTGAVAALVAGTADTDAIGVATLACLTDAEAAALLG